MALVGQPLPVNLPEKVPVPVPSWTVSAPEELRVSRSPMPSLPAWSRGAAEPSVTLVAPERVRAAPVPSVGAAVRVQAYVPFGTRRPVASLPSQAADRRPRAAAPVRVRTVAPDAERMVTFHEAAGLDSHQVPDQPAGSGVTVASIAVRAEVGTPVGTMWTRCSRSA